MVAAAQGEREYYQLALRDIIPQPGEICPNVSDSLSVMHGIGSRLEAAGLEHLLPFNEIYSEVTGNVAERLSRAPGSDGAFREPETVNYMVGKFADYYFKQLRGYLGLSDERIDPAWQLLLYPESAPYAVPELEPLALTAQSEEMPPGIKFLLGMNAHINYDLGQALCDPKVTSDYYDDYTRLVGLIIRITADKFADTYIPGPKWSRKLATWLTVATIARWRENAWKAGEDLKEAENQVAVEGIINHLNRKSIFTGRRIAGIGSVALRGLSRLPARSQLTVAA